MASHAVQRQRLESIPLAVIRRQVRASELSRVVPECCGLVWNQVRAQQAKGGRHVAVYCGHWQNERNANPSQIRTDVYYLLSQ